MTQIKVADDIELDAQHECLETIVAQKLFVSIWGHTAASYEKKLFSVDVWKLQDGFHALSDAPMFERREKIDIGERVWIDYGEHIETTWHDEFASAFAVLERLIAEESNRILEHS